MVLLCFFLFLWGFFVFSILLFLTLMKKNNQLTPGSDSTIRSLATHTKEECALGNVIPVYSNLLKGALERIMRLFFVLILNFGDGLLWIIFHLFFWNSLHFLGYFSLQPEMIEAVLGLELFLLLCFSHHRKWNSIMHLQADALIKEMNCIRARNARFKGLFRLCYGL